VTQLIEQLDYFIECSAAFGVNWRVISETRHSKVGLVVEWLSSRDTNADTELRSKRDKYAMTESPRRVSLRIVTGVSGLYREQVDIETRSLSDHRCPKKSDVRL